MLHLGRDHAKREPLSSPPDVKHSDEPIPVMGNQESHLREVTGENVVTGGSLGPGTGWSWACSKFTA